MKTVSEPTIIPSGATRLSVASMGRIGQIFVILTTATILLLWLVISSTPVGFLLLALSITTYFNYTFGGRDVLYPAFIFTAIWTVASAVYCFCPIEIDYLGWQTAFIFLGGAVSFSFGSLLGNRPVNRDGRSDNVTFHGNLAVRNILLAYAVLVVLLFAHDSMRIAGMGFSLSPVFFIVLRTAILDSVLAGASPYSSKLVSTGPMIAILTLWVLIMEDRRRWAIGLCSLCVAVVAVLSTGRTLAMQALCGCLCLVILRCKRRSFLTTVRPLVIAGIGVLILMVTMSLLTKVETQESNGREIATNMAFEYIAGPLAAFNYAVYHSESFKDGRNNTFADVITPMAHYGLIRDSAPSSLGSWVSVPFGANVYTCYGPYYLDFGIAGCIVAFLLFGFVEGRLFFAMIHGNHTAKFLFAYFTYAMVFSIFDDEYHILMRYLYLFAFVVGYFYLLSKMPLKLKLRILRSHMITRRESNET